MASRDIGVFLRDIIRKPPATFPYIAAFHVLMFIVLLGMKWGLPITEYYIDVFWMASFTICWIYVCDLRKWAAIGYTLLTIANLGIFMFFQFRYESVITREGMQATYVSALLIPALLFTFFVLFYFRRLNE